MFPATLQRVLVPLDFSDLADRAFDAAVVLARPAGARLTLVHAFQPPYLSSEASQRTADLVTAMEHSALRQLAARASRAEHQGVRCEIFARVGTPHVEIVHMVEQKNPDLLVMSAYGHTGFKHALLGSVVERVLQRARCPVLVIPAR